MKIDLKQLKDVDDILVGLEGHDVTPVEQVIIDLLKEILHSMEHANRQGGRFEFLVEKEKKKLPK